MKISQTVPIQPAATFTNSPIPTNDNSWVTIFLAVAVSLGIPKILSLFAESKRDSLTNELKREDEIYKSVLSSSSISLQSVLEINKTLMQTQSEHTQKLFELTSTLIFELRELREVVKDNYTSTRDSLKKIEEHMSKVSVVYEGDYKK